MYMNGSVTETKRKFHVLVILYLCDRHSVWFQRRNGNWYLIYREREREREREGGERESLLKIKTNTTHMS